ncbi:hypothetical protein FSP39_012216 [Pinctada imbricata]|uniref:CUB domain-containing protein n=1 Tax=Pinctada imbricata TaxID=66713 RepID=A0AA88Y8B8_PINIB|nr:hypothetical protein FSP39_012216 [Pinctada imbricata]
MDCRWLFSGPTASDRVVIDIQKYYIEGSPGCRYDYLEYVDGQTLSSAEPQRVCNVAQTGVMYVTSGQYGLLRLKSDFSVQWAGFTLRYLLGKANLGGSATDCSSTISLTATSTKQYFTNSQWPDEYDMNENCLWSITPTTANYGIEVEVVYSDLVSGEVCYSDLLEIYSGDSTSTGTRLQLLCDNRRSFPGEITSYTSSTTRADVKYTALLSGYRRRGFVMAYKEVDIGITTTPLVITTTPTPVSTCSSSTISLTASSTSQFITTPDYPVFYAANQNCRWLVNAPAGSIINLRVIDSSLEDSEGCMGDRVVIYDGSGTNYPVLTTFCGPFSNDVNSTSNEMLVTFYSDGSAQERGFKFEYSSSDHTTPSCVDLSTSNEWNNLTATTTAQYFTSPNYPDNYNSSVTIHWLIHNPTDTGVIKLETVDSRLESDPGCSYDSVTVYKGPCSTYPQLGFFCGTNAPTLTQDVGSYALVVFKTDGTTEFKGFRMKYYVTEADEDDTSIANTIGLIVGIVVGVVALAGIIGALIWAAKAGKLPGFKPSAEYKRHRRGSLSSVSSSSSSSSSESSSEDRERQPRPGTSKGRMKHKQLPPMKDSFSRLPPLDSYSRNVNILPKIK